MRISRWVGVSALVLATGAGPAAQQEDPALEALLTRATWYALDFVDKLSSVVAEERYVQDSERRTADGADSRPRRAGWRVLQHSKRIGEASRAQV